MLIKCPECELQVSDKALSCPHCGYPMKNIEPVKQTSRSKKRLKLPNGFGQISKLKDPRLRNRYRAMITVGKTDTGRPICKPLKPKAYFATYNEAYEALVEYNKNPYELDTSISVKELYEIWSSKYFETIKPSATRTITSAWVYCSDLYYVPVRSLKAYQIKECMESGTAEYNGEIRVPSAAIKSRIKSLFNLMLDYAVEYEYVDRNVARTFKISENIIRETKKTAKEHVRFTDDELKILWQNIDVPYVKAMLIQCYMGWRPQELCLLETENINLENWTITGGMKTEAGENRVVPVHSAIRKIVQELHNPDDKYLFELTYDKYRYRFGTVVKELGLNPEHRPHDPRKTFVSLCKDSGVDEYAIKRLVGHTVSDITEAIYTTRDPRWLFDEIEKIKVPDFCCRNAAVGMM